MTPRPQFASWVNHVVLPGEGVVLLSERGQVLLRGERYVHLAALLDGQHAVDTIIRCLQPHFLAGEIFSTLVYLRSQGYLVDASPVIPPEQAAIWHTLGVSTETAVSRLQAATVSVVACAGIDPAPFQAILVSLGVQIVPDGGRWIVLTDDYLSDDLAVVNQKALHSDRPWLLVKLGGTESWFGPIFLPGHTACWECLAHRLRGTRKVEHYLQERLGSAGAFPRSFVGLPSTLHAALNLAATETLKWIVCERSESLEGRIVTLHTTSLETTSHVLVRRPQCPRCGDAKAFTTGQSAPLVLQSRPKAFTTDGGHRTLSPEETVKKLTHHVSPITGIVSILQPTTTWTGEGSPALSYVTSHNFIHTSQEDATGMDFLYSVLRDGSAGKGRDPTQAKASALCEAIERYSGMFQGDEARFRARFTDLGATAIHPNAYMLFSERQFEDRKQWNALGLPSSWVPEPFNVDVEVEWSPVWSLTHNQPRYMPTAYCYYWYARTHEAWFARANSNGCAAGHNKEEAILQGFMELVERDSVAVWWYNQLRKPAVDLSSFSEPYCQELQAYYRTLHRDLWVLDLTTDFRIPSFAVVSCRNDQVAEDVILGFGTHFDPRIALLRALTEVNQSLPTVTAPARGPTSTYMPSALAAWCKAVTRENQPCLTPDDRVTAKACTDFAVCHSEDLYEDVLACVEIAAKKGLEMLVLDQTRPDTGLHVVKVIVPGLRHFWPRFAPGRLYELPVQMGWLTHPLPEAQLNAQRLYF